MSEIVEIEPSYFEEMMQQLLSVDAMVEECDSIIRNNALEFVPRQQGKLVIRSRWIYKMKYETDGSLENHMSICFSIEFSQVEVIYYEDTFSPIARYSSIISILALSAHMGL